MAFRSIKDTEEQLKFAAILAEHIADAAQDGDVCLDQGRADVGVELGEDGVVGQTALDRGPGGLGGVVAFVDEWLEVLGDGHGV